MVKVLIALCCAVFFVGTVNADTELTAEYYKTEYWGETKQMERQGMVYLGREWKTYRVFPEVDFGWVSEELTNGDDFEIAFVWYSEGANAIGVSFDNIKVLGRYDSCALLVFGSWENAKLFLDNFKGIGDNVAGLVENIRLISCHDYMSDLHLQIVESSNKTIGE